MKTLILCGGRGTYDFDRGERIPKGMSLVGGRPVLWHVMKLYSLQGHNDFVLALGKGSEQIRDYFLKDLNSLRDLEFNVGTQKVRYLDSSPEESWTVKMIDTGDEAQTGSRIARCRKYLEGERFFATYSDCLCNLNLTKLLETHGASGKMLTVTGIQPTSRFGSFTTDTSGNVVDYKNEARMTGIGGWIHGGFMVMEPTIFDHVNAFAECSLEKEIFTKLAQLGEVGVFPHAGFWQAVDTERDVNDLNRLFSNNQRPWLPDASALVPM